MVYKLEPKDFVSRQVLQGIALNMHTEVRYSCLPDSSYDINCQALK
jgi:hypothetical protein